MQEFPWIATEKEFFGKPGSDYDFEAQDVQAAFEEYEAANQSLQRLANKVNRKVCYWLHDTNPLADLLDLHQCFNDCKTAALLYGSARLIC